MDTWGVVSTIKAPAYDILRFVAHHLEAGAHRIYICLDAPCPEARPFLKAHKQVRLFHCGQKHWKQLNGYRPKMHQPRQTLNATHVYHKANEVDWLIHIDVDEFLVADQPIAAQLSSMQFDILAARSRPMELLAGGTNAFKRFIPPGPDREKLVNDLYPTFGEHLKGGFLSHIAGKLFVRTGIKDLKLRIHNAFLSGDFIEPEKRLTGTDLAHLHTLSWEHWLNHFTYRFNKGSYRSDLGAERSRSQGGMSKHELFAALQAEDGEKGLRSFFDEVCADSPALRQRLAEQNLLSIVDLNLDATLSKHFPDFAR